MSIKIDVSADVSGIQSELKKVQDSVNKINQSMSSGEVGLNVKDAKNDLSDLEESAKKLVDLLDKAKKAGNELSGVDFSDVSDALSDAADAADMLDKVLEAVGQSSGISKTVKGAKDTADQMKRAADSQKVLLTDREKYDRARKSGIAGTRAFKDLTYEDLMGGGWRGVHTNESTAKRQTRDMLKFAGASVPSQLATADSEKDKKDAENKSRAGRYAALAGAVGGFAGSMGQGGGMYGTLGGVAGSGIGAGAGMLLGGPIGAVVGAFASRALGGLGSGIDSQIGSVGEEGSIYTDLRRSLGATSVDFDMLRGSVRHLTDGLGLAYGESAKLAKEFAHTANLNADNGMTVGREVSGAVGFGRGYGVSPEQSVSFMASMRQLGVTSNEQGNRKLALQIAESVKNGGTTAKMDEVLNAVQGYVQNSTRQSLTGSDPAAFASFLASMTGSSLNGIKGNPLASAAIMGQADSSMRQGGGFGEASKNFSLGLWQRNMQGFTALDQDYMNEQGAFGSIEKAFGSDSAAYKFAQERGDTGKLRQYDQWVAGNKGKSVMDMQMSMLEKEYGGNTDMFRQSIQSHFGVGAGQASALYQAWKNNKSLGGLESQLKDAGIDTNKMDTKQIASLAELTTADRSGLNKQADRLKDLKGSRALSDTEKEMLSTAKGQDDETLRKAILQLSATHDALGDTGEQQRQLQVDMNRAMQELATKLIPLTLTIKDGIVELVRWASPKSDFVKSADKAAEKEQKEKADAADLDKQIVERKAALDNPNQTPQERERNEVMYNKLVKQRNSIDSVPSDYEPVDVHSLWGGDDKSAVSAKHNDKPRAFSSKGLNDNQQYAYDKVIAEAKRQGLNEDETNAVLSLVNHESRFKANVQGSVIQKGMHKGDRAYGLFQYMAKSSQGWDRTNIDENIAHGVGDFKKRSRRYGIAGAIAAHQGGEGVLNHDGTLKHDRSDGNETTSQYVAKILHGANDEKAKLSPKEAAAQNMSKEQEESKPAQNEAAQNVAKEQEEPKPTPKEMAVQNVGKELEESKPTAKVSAAPNINNAEESKVPAGAAAQNQAGDNQKVSFNGEFVLRDSAGRQISDPIIKTGFAAPKPSGVMA